MSKKIQPAEENKMITVYANTSISINGIFIQGGETKEIDTATATMIKKSRLASMVVFK